MAFETGVSTSPSDLLSKLVTRLTTDGWTIIRTNGGAGADVVISDGSAAETNLFAFRANDTAATASLRCQPAVSDAGMGAAFFAHTGSPNTSGSISTLVPMGHHSSGTDQGFSGPHVAYFFFTGTTSDGRYCHIAVEGTTGVYFHMMFGTCEKAGTFSGGQYVTGMNVGNVASHVQWMWDFAAPGSFGTMWFRNDDHFTTIGQTTDAGVSRWFEDVGFAGNQGSSSHMAGPTYMGGLQAFNQRTPFGPIWCHVFNSLTPTPTSTAWKLCGHIPDARFVSMDGREPGDTIVIGADTWHVFPMHRKTTDGTSTTSDAYDNSFSGGGAPNNDSNLMGVAFREVP